DVHLHGDRDGGHLLRPSRRGRTMSSAPIDEVEGDNFGRAFDPKRQALVAFGCGVVFAIGLGLAGMTSPANVLAFLDVTSPPSDPSLAFVMMSAIGVHFWFASRAQASSREARRPLLAPRFYLPTGQSLDKALLVGAAIFGAGWGLGGYCPGPAIVAFVVTP